MLHPIQSSPIAVLNFRCQHPVIAAAEQVPDPSIVHGLRTALDAGYIPCLEAVLRRHLLPYMSDHERKLYSCTASTGPQDLAGV